MSNYCRALSLLFALLFMSSFALSQAKLELDDQLVRVSYKSAAEKEDRDAYVYLPRGYKNDPNKKWPVIIFLHGDGERGNAKNDLDYVLKHGPLYEAWVQKRDLPFIIISPQLPLYGRDTISTGLKSRDISKFPKRLAEGTPERVTNIPKEPMAGALANDQLDFTAALPPNGWERSEKDVIEVFSKVLKTYRADANRVYLTGLSYGGFGTWIIASRYPQYFAAINPIVGWAHPDWIDPIAKNNIPVWVVAGGRDPYFKTKYFFTGVNKLEALGHKHVRFTIHEDMGHDAWTRVYAGQDIYDWFLSHVKK